jgi:hypothetical protein
VLYWLLKHQTTTTTTQQHNTTTQQQLLSSACLNYDAKPPGHRQVTDALEHYRTFRHERGRFETIVQSLKLFDNESYLVTVIKFLNAGVWLLFVCLFVCF